MAYTDEEAQDAVGTILTDTANIKFTYDDATPEISADLSTSAQASLASADSALQNGDHWTLSGGDLSYEVGDIYVGDSGNTSGTSRAGFNGSRAAVGYNGSGAYKYGYLAGGPGKSARLITDGDQTRLDILSNGEMVFSTGAGNDERMRIAASDGAVSIAESLSVGGQALGSAAFADVGTAQDDLKALNSTGAFLFDLTANPAETIPNPWEGGAGGAYSNWSIKKYSNGNHVGNSWWAAAISNEVVGSGGTSTSSLDGALWLNCWKDGWRDGHTPGNGVKGPITTLMVVANNNEWDDTGAIVTSAARTYGTEALTNTNGSLMQYEGGSVVWNSAGDTVLRELHVLIGWDHNPQHATFQALHPGENSGITVEPNTGSSFAAYVAQDGGVFGTGRGFKYLLVHATHRNASTIQVHLTGTEHADGNGLLRAGAGTAAHPSLSTYTDPETGFYSGGNGVMNFATNGTRTMVLGNGLRLGNPAGGDMGVGTLNAAAAIYVWGSKVVDDRRTGWTTATGTATRTSFATNTVTLPQLAERVKALIDDLHADAGHGLIGS